MHLSGVPFVRKPQPITAEAGSVHLRILLKTCRSRPAAPRTPCPWVTEGSFPVSQELPCSYVIAHWFRIAAKHVSAAPRGGEFITLGRQGTFANGGDMHRRPYSWWFAWPSALAFALLPERSAFLLQPLPAPSRLGSDMTSSRLPQVVEAMAKGMPKRDRVGFRPRRRAFND